MFSAASCLDKVTDHFEIDITDVPWAIVGFIFQFVIRRRHFAWWSKYNYVLSAALDSGVAISIVVIFFW